MHTCSMQVVLNDLTGGGGVPFYWATMQADTWLKKGELWYSARWLIFA